MPFPWKKAKVTRITRMVADLQSPKRGGSLVVETGFPTSLIDLFVKNRDKLRRPSIKRKKKKKNKPITVAADTPAHDPPPIAAADDDDDDNLPVDSEIASLPAAEPEKQLATAAVAMTRATKAAEIGSPEAVFLAAIRVFAVAALALSTKKLVIGVTLSAFVLLFLEFVGKRLVLRLMRPFGSKDKDEDEDEDEEFVAVRELVVVDETGSQSSAEGIEASAAGNSRDEEAFGPDLELLSRDRKWGFLDSNCQEQEQVLVVDNSKISSTSSSKRAKIRKKIISNFVPKKLRSSKKSKKLNVLVEVFEEQEEEEEAQEGRESGAIGAKENCEEIEEDGAEEAIESSAVSEEDGDGRGGVGGRGENWAAVAMLLVVVLLGLFGGRIFALLLTIVWCFAMKLIGIGTQKRSSS